MSKTKRIVLYILIAVFSLGFIISGVILAREYSMRARDNDTFDELATLIELPPTESVVYDHSYSEDELSADDEETSQPPVTVVHKRNLEPVIERNPDCVGWIYIENTQVNYPVVHTPKEPEKYLHLSFDLKYSAYGVPFLDYRCKTDSDNIILYGHNMKDGSMFATVRPYMEKDYFLEHPTVEFETVDGCKTYSVFALASVKASDSWYSNIDFKDREQYINAVKRIMSKSLYETNVLPEYGKQIITLSTCYGAERDDRIILLAVED